MFLGNSHTLVAKQYGHAFNRYARQEKLHSERVAEPMRMCVVDFCEFEERY